MTSLLTTPYEKLLSFSHVLSATYANAIEKVAEKTPEIAIVTKYPLQVYWRGEEGKEIRNEGSERRGGSREGESRRSKKGGCKRWNINENWTRQNTVPYTALKESTGIGIQVKNTHSSKKDLRPHASDIAPISGADKKDSRPYGGWVHVSRAGGSG